MLILSEENKKLKGTVYKLPDNFYNLFLKIVQKNPGFINDPGYKRSKNVLGDWPYVTMEWLKNMKHFFTINDQNSDSYRLAGGDDIKFWVDEKLRTLISTVGKSKKVNSPTKPRSETSALAGAHGDHQTSSLSMVNALLSGLIPKFESKGHVKILIINEDQLLNFQNIYKNNKK